MMSATAHISKRCRHGAHEGTQGHLLGPRVHSGRRTCTGYKQIGECECPCHNRRND